MSDIADLTQIGLSVKAHAHLERLKNEDYFAEMREAYKFAIALALSKGVDAPELPAPRQNIFATPTVDPDGAIAIAIRMLMPSSEIPPYRWAERLAEAGVEMLITQANAGGIDIAALIVEAEEAAAAISRRVT